MDLYYSIYKIENMDYHIIDTQPCVAFVVRFLWTSPQNILNHAARFVSVRIVRIVRIMDI